MRLALVLTPATINLQGPNYLWHIDGFDKLNRWGFYIHGAIDGYNRKILWLHVFVTNKDPWLVGKFFYGVRKREFRYTCTLFNYTLVKMGYVSLLRVKE